MNLIPFAGGGKGGRRGGKGGRGGARHTSLQKPCQSGGGGWGFYPRRKAGERKQNNYFLLLFGGSKAPPFRRPAATYWGLLALACPGLASSGAPGILGALRISPSLASAIWMWYWSRMVAVAWRNCVSDLA